MGDGDESTVVGSEGSGLNRPTRTRSSTTRKDRCTGKPLRRHCCGRAGGKHLIQTGSSPA